MKIEKIETVRVSFENDIYCDITPSLDAEGARDFWLYKKGDSKKVFMFALFADVEKSVEIAEANYEDYLDVLLEEEDDD